MSTDSHAPPRLPSDPLCLRSKPCPIAAHTPSPKEQLGAAHTVTAAAPHREGQGRARGNVSVARFAPLRAFNQTSNRQSAQKPLRTPCQPLPANGLPSASLLLPLHPISAPRDGNRPLPSLVQVQRACKLDIPGTSMISSVPRQHLTRYSKARAARNSLQRHSAPDGDGRSNTRPTGAARLLHTRHPLASIAWRRCRQHF